MHNIIILGTARSGTSLVTSLFRNAGCYCGDNYVPARVSNPTGFFEDSVVNQINDDILARIFLTKFLRRLPKMLRPRLISDRRALWLAAPRFALPFVPKRIIAMMRERVSRTPFCFKDPRFSVTLRYWRPWLPPETRFLVVFRDPHVTVNSMLREAEEGFVPPIEMNARDAYKTWHRSYKTILSASLDGESWLFVNYNDVLNGSAVPAIAAFADASLETSLIDPRFSRSSGAQAASSRDRAASACETLFAILQAKSERDKSFEKS